MNLVHRLVNIFSRNAENYYGVKAFWVWFQEIEML